LHIKTDVAYWLASGYDGVMSNSIFNSFAHSDRAARINAELMAYAEANDLQIMEIPAHASQDSDALYCGDYPAPCNCDDPTTHDREALKYTFPVQGFTKFIPASALAGAVVFPTPELKDIVCGDYPAPCNCDDPETHSGH